MKICIGNLGKYNEGIQLYQWLELPTSTEEIEKLFVKIKVGHYDESGEYIAGYEEGPYMYEEIHIVDWEDIPEGITVDRYSNINELNDIAEMWENLKEYEKPLIEAILELESNDLEQAIERSKDCIYFVVNPRQDESGQYYDLGKHYLEEIGGLYEVPEHLKNYIDFESYGRDLNASIASNGYCILD